jgi:hypothetical protein
VTGTVREMPIVSNNSPVDASPPAIAILDDRVLVAWLETLPAAAPYSQPRISTVGLALCDRDLNILESSALTPPIQFAPLIARSGTDRFWIVARDQIWWATPAGTFSTGTGFGRVADDMTVTNNNPQIVAHQIVPPRFVSCATPCPGANRWLCPQACQIMAPQWPLLYALTLYGNVDERPWQMAGNLPVAVRANDGKDVLLVWFSDTGGMVMAMRAPPSLPLVGLSPRAIGTYVETSRADIATDGQRYVIVWQTMASTGGHDVIGASLEPDGHVVQMPIATSLADEHDPSIVATGPGSFLVTYRKDASDGQRIAGRTVTFNGRRRTVQ